MRLIGFMRLIKLIIINLINPINLINFINFINFINPIPKRTCKPFYQAQAYSILAATGTYSTVRPAEVSSAAFSPFATRT